MIAHRQKILVKAELNTVEIAKRAILQDAAQRDHVIGRRVEPRQALVGELRHSDQKGVPGHDSTKSSRRRGRSQALGRAHQLLEADPLRIELETDLSTLGLYQNLCRRRLAGEDGLQRLQHRLQHSGGDGERKAAEQVDQPSFRLIRGRNPLRLNPLHTGKACEDIAHFVGCGRNFARRRVANRADLQREVHFHPPYRCYWLNSAQGNHLEKEPTLTIYLRGAKDSCELNHTCRHSPAVPAAAPAAAAGYC
jgi:hypothetical protein